MSNYRLANTTVQWFEDNYPGATMNLSEATEVVVLHTTEGTGWPSYNGGATAPNYTARPNFGLKRLEWRAHFPDEKSSRALQNLAGGVETNTLNAVQVELVGTCDPAKRFRWGTAVAGKDYIFWPEAPEWALRDVARFLADQHRRHGLQLRAPVFVAYPGSYGSSPTRFTFTEWRSFAGICGHQHVPENSHGDPGNLDVPRILNITRQLLDPPVLRFVVTDEPTEGLDASVKITSKGIRVYGNVKRVSSGTAEGVFWTKATWHRHRFLFITWTEFQRENRREIRGLAKRALASGSDVIVVGRPGSSRIFTPERMCKRLGLEAHTVGGVTFGFPKSLDVEDAVTVRGAVVFELEKPK